MSQQFRGGGLGSAGYGALARETVASYESYVDAQRAVDFLSDEHFPVQKVRIVGSELRMIEQVLGRMDWGRAFLRGALTGAWFGLLVGLLLSLFTTTDSGTSGSALVLYAVMYGAVFGMIFGLVSYALTGGKRDFVSRSQIVPQHFEVQVEREQAEEARQVLSRLTG